MLPQQRSFGETSRRDNWWLTPVLVFTGLSLFIVYSTWAALQGQHYTHGPYLSPFYSPELFGNTEHSWFGPFPSWWPIALASPAILILWAPAGFRLTCYYYRGAYYKAFWADPPNCAVGEPRKGYLGEQWWPLKIQNVHRYFMYVAVLFLFLLAYDVMLATRFPAAGGGTEFGVGLGTIILAVNVVLLTCYTLGCHVARHLVGGLFDEVSKHPVCDKAYACSTVLNYKHQLFAWCSLFSVAGADIYVRLCSMGFLTDVRFI